MLPRRAAVLCRAALAAAPAWRVALVSRSTAVAPVAPFHSCSLRPLLAASCSSSPKPPGPTAPFDQDTAMSNLATSFADARMDIEDAIESVGSTYYSQDVQQAIDSTNSTLLQFQTIQEALGAQSSQALKLRESWGMRLEQLKQELQQAISAGGGEEH